MKTLLIDLWGTLLQNSEIGPVEEIINKLNLEIKHHKLIQLADKKGLFSKTISSLIIWETILKELGRSNEEAKLADDIWLNSSRTVNLFPGTKKFLKTLKEQQFTLVLASAIDKDSFDLLEKQFSFADYFDQIKTTYQLGVGKSEEYYQKICDDLKLNPTETCMIGDNIAYDIIPANKSNLNTILLSRFLLTDFEKDSLPSSTNICSSFEEVLQIIIK